jgi:hypothetical protein
MTDTKITEAEPVKVSDTAVEIASFDQNVLIFETWVTDILAALADDSPNEKRVRIIFAGVAELFRELSAQQLRELNAGRSTSPAYIKFEELKPQLQAILDRVKPIFSDSQLVRQAVSPIVPTPPGAPPPSPPG